MPTPRDSFAKLRTSVGTGVKHALAQTRGRAEPGPIYARARPDHAEITESYFVEQEISKNPWLRTGRSPVGQIELTVPYDGHECFTRHARDDVARAIAAHPESGDTAVIGHLLLQDYANTTLRSTLALSDRHGSVPIEVPINSDGVGGGEADNDPGSLDHLTADRRTCVITYEFEPDFSVLPARLGIELSDPDSLGLLSLDLKTPEGRARVGDVIRKIREQVSFQNHLLLHIVVRLNVPAKADLGDLRPEVARMSIGWPTITSLRTLHLRVGRLADNGADIEYSDEPVQYDPVKKCLEWENVPMFPRPPAQGDANVRVYESAVMLLSIQHPGELYREDSLKAHAEVKIPGYLLSGLTARIYDATGHLSAKPQPMLTTRVCATAELKLDDAFATRDFSPYHQLFFDEIIPDDMRITDIVTALKDRGFEEPKVLPPDHEQLRTNVPDTANWFLMARRQEGPDTMELWIFVEGRRFETERETTVHGGGVTHKTKLQSGELRVFIRGTLARDSKELTHEMNTLQRMLRERYGRVRQRR